MQAVYSDTNTGSRGTAYTLTDTTSGTKPKGYKTKGVRSMEGDIIIVCEDCNQPFTWSRGEQEFYRKKGFDNGPKRCKDCRAKRKAWKAKIEQMKGGKKG